MTAEANNDLSRFEVVPTKTLQADNDYHPAGEPIELPADVVLFLARQDAIEDAEYWLKQLASLEGAALEEAGAAKRRTKRVGSHEQ